ncbi:uncharacterized protein A1O5_01157 [Cladophialophora psammophila CBS 110553]|uniref:PNPLA domain-containing protein n=1 Tax=Cladophialophora psammophila CBS 110553 TaxID=1182543 RepID=W9Y2F0_9EURO|nr:uncharacterized protein A1O5_01157 [Cladophialophora psammophila CBS 110553]EXJ76649.1 hypothetical protein A1O5_01157 [Cladophialophora psammophila CBS 110553]
MATSEHIRLLSIDGGGLRGLSAIMVLKHIMAKINHDRADKLQPYEVFDLIGGTGVGGLIALMLGRLHMSLDKVEEAYIELLGKIFHSSEVVRKLSDHMSRDLDTSYEVAQEVQALSKVEAEFRTDPVKVWLNDLFRRMRWNRDGETELLKDPDLEVPCKTYVNPSAQIPSSSNANSLYSFLTAWHTGDISPQMLRTYRNAEYQQPEFHKLKMWEAACATVAAGPGFVPFRDEEDKHLPRHNYTKVPLQWNNPINLMFCEAQELWKDKKFLILSIGTGAAPKGKTDLEEAFHEAEKVADVFEHMIRHQHPYYRFNVEEEMDKIGLAELQEGPEIARAVDDYLSRLTVEPRLNEYVEAIMSEERMKGIVLKLSPIERYAAKRKLTKILQMP